MSQQNRPDFRDPVLDVVDPGEGHSGFQEQGSAELRDQAVLAREQLRRGLFKSRPEKEFSFPKLVTLGLTSLTYLLYKSNQKLNGFGSIGCSTLRSSSNNCHFICATQRVQLTSP